LFSQPWLGAGGEVPVLGGTGALTVDRLTLAEVTGKIAGTRDLVRTRSADLQAHVAVIATHPNQRDRHRCGHGWSPPLERSIAVSSRRAVAPVRAATTLRPDGHAPAMRSRRRRG